MEEEEQAGVVVVSGAAWVSTVAAVEAEEWDEALLAATRMLARSEQPLSAILR